MTLCQERVNRGTDRWPDFQPCGRPVKEDGLCGLHLAARKRRQARDKKYDDKNAAADALHAQAKELGNEVGRWWVEAS